jgi:hypothetical protein
MNKNALAHALQTILGIAFISVPVVAQADISATGFTAGDLVISTVNAPSQYLVNGVLQSTALDTASAITLKEFSLGNNGTSASYADSLSLPQNNSGNNNAISGEFGSASEGILQQSLNGQYLTIMGYGVNANTFNNAALGVYGTTAALGQTTSLTSAQQQAANPSGPVYNTVARVVGLIGANGSVDTSTALTGVFNQNNPRSVATVDGSSFYVSGQGASNTDAATQGVFYATLGASTATQVYGATNTRAVELVNGSNGPQLYVSRDYNPPGSASTSNPSYADVSTLTTANNTLPTSSSGTTDTIVTPGSGAPKYQDTITVSAGNENGVNNTRLGSFVYLSPEQYFFASVNGGVNNVMYVTDSGQPKNGSANTAALGEGGLQKWELINDTWTLMYDLVNGLNLVNNANANANTPTAAGITGLFGLTAQIVTVNGQQEVELFATSYGLNELSPSSLFEITDNLSDTTIDQASNESFTTLYTAAAGEDIRGVAFAPGSAAAVPVPTSAWLFFSGLIGMLRCKRRSA